MTIQRGIVTQTGADAFTAATIDTDLSSSGKTGWLITGFKVNWSLGYTAAAADATLKGVLATIATATTPDNHDELARVSWGVQNTGGVAVAMNFEPEKVAVIQEGRLTVQPKLYVHCSSTTTGLTNVIYYEFN